MTEERVRPPEPLRSPWRIRLSDAGLAALVLGLAVFLRFFALGADPPLSLSESNSEVMDGPWYLAEAVDGARGREADIPREYRKPAFTAAARVAFEVGGVSLATAHALEAALGVLLVLAGTAAAYARYATKTALLAGLFLATSFPLVGYARVPLVYGPLAAALGLVCLFFFLGLARPAFHVLAWATLAGAALGLKQSALVLAPALVAGHVVAARRRGLAAAVAVAAGAGLAAAAWSLRPGAVDEALEKLSIYFSAPEGLEGWIAMARRLIASPVTSGLALKAFPLVALAWLGVLVASARYAPREGDQVVDLRIERAADTFLVVWLLATVLFHGVFEYIDDRAPLRHFVPALVPAALLAARTITRLAKGVEAATTRPAIALWAFFAGYALIACGANAVLAFLAWRGKAIALGPVARTAIFWSFVGAAALVVAPLAVRILGRRFAAGSTYAVRLSPLGAVLAVAAIFAWDAAFLGPALARSTTTLRDANGLAGRLLAPGASVFGPWAHALTYDAPGVLRHHRSGLDVRTDRALLEPRAYGYTHIAVDAAWGPELERVYRDVARTPLIPVARLEVRGWPIMIYRFSWAEAAGYRLSPLERGVPR